MRGCTLSSINFCTSLIVVTFKIGAITPNNDSYGVFSVPIRMKPFAYGCNFNKIR